MKFCANKECKNLNPQDLINFSKRKKSKDGLRTRCKTCDQVTKESYRKIPENNQKEREAWKLYNRTNARARREASLIKKYGISLNEYHKLQVEQNNRCKICNISMLVYNEYFAVDHDHLSGKVRGLLCKQCNLGLGNFKDNKELLLNAIKYLR